MNRFIPKSLRFRLLFASAVVLPLIVVLAVLTLQRAYLKSQETAEAAQAQLQVYLLLGIVEFSQGQIQLPDIVPEPGFVQPGSGNYAIISDEANNIIWLSRSSSLLNEQLIDRAASQVIPLGETQFQYFKNDGLYLFQYPFIWDAAETERRFMVSVYRSDRIIKNRVSSFSRQLWGAFIVIVFLALIMQSVILYWGLKPLKILAKDLMAIEKGDARQLAGEYPKEVQPVTDNLNKVLFSERQQRERYRNTLADLAHSLKSPLAVIRGAAGEKISEADYRQLIEEQTQRMNQIVQYQLYRAVNQNSVSSSNPVGIKPIVERVAKVLEKVYVEKKVSIRNAVDDSAHFWGDERDLMELLGNLMDNACKYGKDEVWVNSCVTGTLLYISIEDNGKGVPVSESQAILERGKRADTSISGQGIGLAVVVDILSSYDGALEVSRSDRLQGACFTMALPLNHL